jgi:hypothetical protein
MIMVGREPFMTSFIATCLILILGLVFILGSTASTMTFAAEGAAPLKQSEWQDQFHSTERT